MSKTKRNQKKWKVGDRYWIYDNNQKLWGVIVNITDDGDHIVEWDCCITTNEGKNPSPASDYFKQQKGLDKTK